MCGVAPRRGAEQGPPHPDTVIASLATTQHGVTSRRQLAAAGLSQKMIERRLASGHLHRVHRGVYTVGHRRLSIIGRRWAAILAAGSEAIIGFRTAAAVHDLRPDNRYVVDIVARGNSRPGIAVHRCRLADADITEVDGLPVTTWARTLLDLATVVDQRGLRRALEQADRHRILNLIELDELFHRTSGHRGIGALKSALAAYDPRHQHARSELERRALEMIDRHRLPRPELNARVGERIVDLLWREQGVVLELDGFDTHRTRAAFERDRARDRASAVAGLTALRATWRQLSEGEAALAADLRTVLSRVASAA